MRLHLEGGSVDTTTLLVSRHGALVRHPEMLSVGTHLPLSNLATGEQQTFRVAWVWPDEGAGGFKVGLAMVDGGSGFWGPGYDQLIAQAPPEEPGKPPRR